MKQSHWNETKKRKVRYLPSVPLNLYKYRPQLLHLPKDYEMYPSAQQIFSKNLIIQNIKIKHLNTTLQWKGLINLSNLKQPLSETIIIDPYSVQVYKSDINKPQIGQQLNRRAVATFKVQKKIRKKMLNRLCQGYGTKLLIFDPLEKEFKIQIPHFTKYDFKKLAQNQDNDSDQDQQEKPQPKTNEKQSNKNILENLGSLKKSKILKPQIQEPQVTFEQPLGTSEFQIEQHNRKMHNYRGGYMFQIKFSGNGSVFQFRKCKEQCYFKQIKKQINKPYQSRIQDQQIQIFFNLLRIDNSQKDIQQFIISNNSSSKMKRIISLMKILFQRHNLSIKKQNNIIEFKIQQNNKDNIQYHLKNWLEWVINNSIDIPLPQNRIYQKLAKRQVQSLIYQQLKYNNLDNAQFLASIEDSLYRQDLSLKNMNLQLSSLLLQKQQCLQDMHWIVRLSFSMWYFTKLTFDQKIKFKKQQEINNFINQYRLIQLYSSSININKDKLKLYYSHQDLNISQSLYTWYISNQLQHLQIKQFRNQRQYQKYRYRLLREIIYKLNYIQQIVMILRRDNYLSQDLKNQILRELLLKRPQISQRLIAIEWNGKNDICDQVQGINYMNKYNELRGLNLLIRINQINPTVRNRIIQTCKSSKFLLNFRRQQTIQSLNLLKKYKQKYPQLQFLYEILLVRCQSKQINLQFLYQFEKYCNQLGQSQKKILLNVIFHSLRKNKQLFSFEYKELLGKLQKLYQNHKEASKLFKVISYQLYQLGRS